MYGCAGSSLSHVCLLSVVAVSGGYSLVAAQTSHGDGFSCCRARALGLPGFHGCDPWTQLPGGMWHLPRLGIEPVSPALTGRFATTGPPGEDSEKNWFKHNIQKTKIMESSPITSWQIDGETMETVTDFIFLGSKITADGDYSHKIKRCLLLGRKTMTNLDSILKSRDITLPTKVHLVKAMVFPVIMYGCEIQTIKKSEH